jgi:ATP-dependent Clp protease ATP-binding subunit ClpC
MFERYTEQARRAIFFARTVTLLNGTPAIDSNNLLYGLMWEDACRAQTLFGLREVFPLYKGSPHIFVEKEKMKAVGGPPLTDEVKKILARTATEADAMRDYWIDTEHLLLGILAEPNCTAAQNLAKANISLERARRVIRENVATRPKYPDYYGPPKREGEMPSLLDKMISKWRKWKYRARG